MHMYIWRRLLRRTLVLSELLASNESVFKTQSYFLLNFYFLPVSLSKFDYTKENSTCVKIICQRHLFHDAAFIFERNIFRKCNGHVFQQKKSANNKLNADPIC